MSNYVFPVLLFISFILEAINFSDYLNFPLMVTVIHSLWTEKIDFGFSIILILGISTSLKPELLGCLLLTPYLLNVIFRRLVLPISALWLLIEIFLKISLSYLLVFVLDYFINLSFPTMMIISEIFYSLLVMTLLIFIIFRFIQNWQLQSSKYL